jgi:hypothetical protein
MVVEIKPIQMRDIDIKLTINMTVAEMRDFRGQLRNNPPSSNILAALDIALAKFDIAFSSAT